MQPADANNPLTDRESDIFEMAYAVPSDERQDYLRQACGDDSVLFQSIRERLLWEERMGGFLERPLIDRVDGSEPFATGDVLGGRFRIDRQAGEGGMAIVYEAFDLKKEQRIALKCPKRPFRKRLLPELRSALEVSHTNVCRVHEVHTDTSGGRDVDFLTMEFLEGPTLLEYFRSQASKPLDVALDISRQICSGLNAAHQQGVVHGDLKPNNIILAKSRSGDLRVVITDFGLARLTSAVGMAEVASHRGTPDFIAPELWRSEAATTKSDLYALGVVLYELFTGRRPMERIAVSDRLTAVPPPFGADGASVPPAIERIVCQCLAPLPFDRPTGAIAVREALRLPAAALPKRTQSRVLATAAVLIATSAALAGGAWIKYRGPQASPMPAHIRLAILPPDTDGPTSALGNGIALDFSRRFVRPGGSDGRSLVVIPLVRVNGYHVKSTEEAAPVLGATHTLQIRTRQVDGGVEAGYTLFDTASRQPLLRQSANFSMAKLGEMPQHAAAALSSFFHLSIAERVTDLRSEGYSEYAQALYYLRHEFTTKRALNLLEKARQADPAAISPRLALAEAAVLEGKSNATLALDHLDAGQESRGLPWYSVAVIYEAAGKTDDAIRAYRSAIRQEPDNGDALCNLAVILSERNENPEAIELLRRSLTAQPDYFGPLLEFGRILLIVGRHAEAKVQFERAIALAPRLASAHHALAAVLTETGQYDSAEKEYQQALNLEPSPDTYTAMGALLASQKRHPESVPYFERAVQTGPEDHLRLCNLADGYRRLSRAAEARLIYEKAFSAATRELNRDPGSADVRSFLGYINVRLDKSKQALEAVERALRESPANTRVRRRAIQVFEVLNLRERSLAVLRDSSRSALVEISRSPDLAHLFEDPRYIELTRKIPAPRDPGGIANE